jgi:hypothetical protein
MEGLEHEADVLRARLRAPVLVERRELDARKPHFAGARLVESREQREQRRLARARAPTTATVFARQDARLTSSRMVSIPSGLVTSLRKLLASRTVFRSMARWLFLALILAARRFPRVPPNRR